MSRPENGAPRTYARQKGRITLVAWLAFAFAAVALFAAGFAIGWALVALVPGIGGT